VKATRVPCTIPHLLDKYSGAALWIPPDPLACVTLVSVLVVHPRRVDIFHGLDENGIDRIERDELWLDVSDWRAAAQVCRWGLLHDGRCEIVDGGDQGSFELRVPRWGTTERVSSFSDQHDVLQQTMDRHVRIYWGNMLDLFHDGGAKRIAKEVLRAAEPLLGFHRVTAMRPPTTTRDGDST